MAKRTFDLGAELRKAGGPTVDTREQIEYIPLDRIDPDPENFYSLDGLDELAGSIELVGLQQPLRVRDGEGGHVIIVSGHRRRAALMLIRDGGSDMFKDGVPCIREKAEELPEMQELKLIFGNAQTRVMSAPELSRQAVKTRDLLARLRDRGYDFPGRTRELVASVLQTSDSRVGRLTAIREKLVPELLTKFDAGRIGETVAYRLSQEDRTTQLKLAIQLGPSVQELNKETVEQVIDQAKKPEKTEPSQSAAPTASSECRAARQDAPPEGEPKRAAAEYSAVDGLKKYLDARHDEDTRFWKYMQEAADDLIKRSFSAGALPTRKDNIDMLRLDCRTGGSYDGSNGSWSGSNKGIKIGVGVNTIERTWFDTYDALAAIAITRWRAVLIEEKRRPKKAVPTVDTGTPHSDPPTAPAWKTGTPTDEGYYAVWARYSISPTRTWDPDYEILYWSGEYWTGRPGGAKSLDYEVYGWYPLPDKGA